MELDGWRLIQTDLKHLRGMGVQEKGMADDLFIRYYPVNIHRSAPEVCRDLPGISTEMVLNEMRARTELIWIEWKSKTGINGQKQSEWQMCERARGALVWVAKQDFPPTIEGFQEHYRKSGLMRKLR